jgi:AcrR family transcriptional regulator
MGTVRAVTAVDRPDTERHEVIVAAATTCFRRWGYVRTRMEDIAKEAGIARPALYRYFSGKDALLLEVIVRHIEDRGRQLHRVLPCEGPAGPLLLRALQWGAEVTDDREVIETILGVEVMHDTARLIAESERVADAMSDYWRPYLEHARVTGALRDGVEPDEAVRWLTYIRFTFLSLPELVPPPDQVEGYLRTYVVSAIVA